MSDTTSREQRLFKHLKEAGKIEAGIFTLDDLKENLAVNAASMSMDIDRRAKMGRSGYIPSLPDLAQFAVSGILKGEVFTTQQCQSSNFGLGSPPHNITNEMLALDERFTQLIKCSQTIEDKLSAVAMLSASLHSMQPFQELVNESIIDQYVLENALTLCYQSDITPNKAITVSDFSHKNQYNKAIACAIKTDNIGPLVNALANRLGVEIGPQYRLSPYSIAAEQSDVSKMPIPNLIMKHTKTPNIRQTFVKQSTGGKYLANINPSDFTDIHNAKLTKNGKKALQIIGEIKYANSVSDVVTFCVSMAKHGFEKRNLSTDTFKPIAERALKPLLESLTEQELLKFSHNMSEVFADKIPPKTLDDSLAHSATIKESIKKPIKKSYPSASPCI